MNDLWLRLSQAILRVLECLEQERTPRLPLSLRYDLEARGEELGGAFSNDCPRVSKRSKDLLEYEVYVWVEVGGAVPRELLEDQDTGIPTGLHFVEEFDSGRNFKVHEPLTESRATDLCYSTKGLGRREHDIDVWVGQEVLDIVVEPEEVSFGVDVAVRFGVQ